MTSRIARCIGKRVRTTSRVGHTVLVIALVVVGLGAAGGAAHAQAVLAISHKDGIGTLDMGRVRTLSNAMEVVNLANSGDEDTTSLVVSVVDNANFEITGAPVGIVAGGMSTFNVVCKPGTPGDRTTSVNVDWQSMTGGPQSLAFDVTCYTPALWINVGADPINFGDVEVGTTSVATNVDIINDDASSVDITGYGYVGAGCATFGRTNDVATTLASMATTTIMVDYSPTARAVHDCTMTVQDNNAGTDNTLAFTGVGVGALISVSTGALDFMAQRVGTTAMLTFIVSNIGDTGYDLDIAGIAFSGTGSGHFAVSPTSFIVAPGLSQIVTVTFNPLTVGPINSVRANIDVAEPTNGTPLDQDTFVTIAGSITEALLTTNVLARSFGLVRVNGATANRSVTMSARTGAEDVTVTSVTLFSGNVGDFEILTTVPPGGSDIVVPAAGPDSTLNLRCNPSGVGPRTTQLVIASDDDGPTPDQVTLNCEGGRSYVSMSSTADIDFGPVRVGNTGNRTLTISNLNNQSAMSLTATFTPAAGSVPAATTPGTQFTTSLAGVTNLLPGNGQSFQVRFNPDVVGGFGGTLTINSDDPFTPNIVINLSGTGVEPDITLTQPTPVAELDFGPIQVNTTSASQTIVIQNDGTSNLTISSATRLAPNPGQFAQVNPPSLVVVPAAQAQWSITCRPTSVGAKSSTFRISSDDPDEPNVTVLLKCEGVIANLVASVSPASGFGTVRRCETGSIDVTMTNEGGLALSVTGITLDNGQYSIAGPTVFSLAPNGGTATHTVDFSPTAAGFVDGKMTIMWQDPPSTTVVNIPATGVLAGMTVDAMTHDFTDVRVDQAPPSRLFTLTNTGTANFRLNSLTLSNTTDFSVVLVSPASIPATLTPSQTATFRVVAQPQTLGAKNATITINTDAPNPPCGTAPLNIIVDANGVSPDINVSPTILDFGPVDIQATPPTMDITVMNPGTAPLEIADLVLPLGSEFSASSNPLPFSIPATSSAIVRVTYAPTAVRAMDEATLSIISDDPDTTQVDVILRGRGIDRDMVPSTMALPFPETYRYPENPPQMTFDIDNRGEADLTITMVDNTGGGETAFTFIDQLDMVVPGLSSDTVVVQFLPTSAGAFDSTIVIESDDDAKPRVEIALSGTGKEPNFTSDSDAYDFSGGTCKPPNRTGCVGVGIPTRLTATLPKGIEFTNTEPIAFTVREVRLVDETGVAVDPTLFRVVDFTSTEVGANSPFSVDVEFTAPAPGDYQATLEVYLNDDPGRVRFVTVTATAIEVRLRGGGCSASEGGATPGLALLVLFVLIGLAGGRARGRAKARALVGPFLLAGLLLPTAAHADKTRNLDLTTLRQLPGVEWEMLSIESPKVGKAGAWFMGILFSHAVNPLNLESPEAPGMSDALVSGRTGFDLAFSYALGDRFEFGAILPMASQSGNASVIVQGVAPAEGFALGDVALHGKVRLYDSNPFSFSAAAVVTAPTASDDQFAGVDGPTGELRGIIGLDLGRVRVIGNAGARLQGSSQFGDLDQGNELNYGVGASYRALRKLWIVGELFGAYGISGDGSTQGVSPLEWSGGVRYRMSREMSIGVGAGWGILGGIGSPDFRGMLLVAYTPKASEIGHIIIEDPETDVIDNGDDDADGIINAKDKCPQEAEDKDGFEDADGCPDFDNDNDGMNDSSDLCPLKAEDKDGFKDDDGCPDEDNDEDGILDVDDKCPMIPEDKDGFQDRDGCDDPDNDSDGIPDVIDQCATEPETINGKQDDDGCPDEGESLVMTMPDRIEVFEPVRFIGKSERINRRSVNLLNQVAATLRANRDFLRIRIAVHTHPRNSRDLELSQKRATAVRSWLVKWGIEPERLETKGYGSARPLVPKNKRGAAKVNDRVEFIILEKRVKR